MPVRQIVHDIIDKAFIDSPTAQTLVVQSLYGSVGFIQDNSFVFHKISVSHHSEVVAYTPEGSVPKMRNAVPFIAKEHRVWLVVI